MNHFVDLFVFAAKRPCVNGAQDLYSRTVGWVHTRGHFVAMDKSADFVADLLRISLHKTVL